MNEVVVVGSGPSGVHFALTLLEKGHAVTLVDVGHPRPGAVQPDLSWLELKAELPDAAAYFLGTGSEGVVFPDDEAEFYGFPPHKNYIFREPPDVGTEEVGFSPLFSYGQGGLAETWTAGCYPLNAAEAADFPLDFASLSAGYDEVAGRIGVTGALDDMERFFPGHAHLQDPLPLDLHSRLLMERYEKKRGYLNQRLGCYLGRTRVATLSSALDGRPPCNRCGRCLWGCPRDSLYVPSVTLDACRRFPGFTYRGGIRVDYLELNGQRATAVRGLDLERGEEVRLPATTVALAAGTLSSARIFLRSIWERDGSCPALSGLMDNRQVLVPFVNLRMLGRRYDPDTYQYHLLMLGLESEDPRDYVHCQITTLKTALLHPVAQQLPFGLAAALPVTNSIHAALGVVNVNFADSRRAENRVSFLPGKGGGTLRMEYVPPAGEMSRVKRALKKVRRALRALGCLAPSAMTHVRPMGASVHYAGVLPMTREPRPWTSDPHGRSRDVENLLLVDGVTFPFLPAKNGTFTLMANAVRIAHRLED